MCSTLMSEEIQQQIKSFIKGFEEIIPYEAMLLLNENELGLKLTGMPELLGFYSNFRY